ncbi:MAG: TIGR02680 family protein [Actinomycetota bacterium]
MRATDNGHNRREELRVLTGFEPVSEVVSELPRPLSERFVPLRAGIVNLWQYDDHEFRFHNGRLLLRGENGMGKSKALELLLPFLLDADLRPERLDPFGDRAKTMRWNLLEDVHASRLGYAWIEFGRLDGELERHVTIGAGLRATASVRDVDSWYFVAHARPGRDFEVVEQRVPLTKERLRSVLEDRGAVYDTKGDYRRAVDDALFELGAERYHALVELLLALRRPQLSAKLDPDALSGLLTTSLPPLDDQKVERLASAFQSLERLEQELDTLRRAHDQLGAFLEEYRGYARVVARRRGAAVRAATTQLDNVTRTVRSAQSMLDEARSELHSIADAKADTGRELAAAEGAIQAIDRSKAMEQAHALQGAKESAERARDDAQRAEQDLTAAAERWERAGASERGAAEDFGGAGRELGAARLRARELAANAALSEWYELHDDLFVTDPAGTHAAAVGMLAERRRALHRLSALAGTLREAVNRVRGSEERRDDRRAEVTEARARVTEAERVTEAALETLRAEMEDWRASLKELTVDDGRFDTLLSAAYEAGLDEGADITRLVDDLALHARTEMARSSASVDGRMEALDEDVAETNAERSRVADEREDGPRPVRARPWRDTLDGAPLWRLCDFRAGLDDAGRSGLEAALEDSGLLDAWMTPAGTMLDPGTLDTVLVAAPHDGPTLADVLAPVTVAPVDPTVIDTVLRSVRLGPTGEVRVDRDGSWALGPLRGRWTKPRAEHIGAAARAAARVRRLAELDGLLESLAASRHGLERERAELQERAQRAERERGELPSTTELRAARREERSVGERRLAAESELERAEAEVVTTRAERDAAQRALRTEASSSGLGAHIDHLHELQSALGDVADGMADLHGKALAHLHARGLLERARAEVAEATSAHDETARRKLEASQRLARCAGEVDALEDTVGAEVAEVIARRESEVVRVRTARQRAESLHHDELDATGRVAASEERLQTAQRERAEREEERAAAAVRFAQLGSEGLLGLVLGDNRVNDAATWSVTRALDEARGVEAAVSEVDASDASHDDARNKVMTFLTQLQRGLGADFTPLGEESQGVFVVRVEHNGKIHGIAGIVAFIGTEVERHAEAFQADERSVIEDFLLKELGLHLQSRITEAKDTVRRVNMLMRSHPTASGLTVQLRWRPNVGSVPGIADALKLLLRDISLMTDVERSALVRFLQERIEVARIDDSAGTYVEHLARAFDYRSWHSFMLEAVKDGRTEVLTKRKHAAGSGGEKAVVLHLPLFAAAAAHYRSAAAHAPRLVMLDEAFAGIDQGMRGSCMALLVAFDLDFVMTSHDEWGCYAELDGLAIYHLVRDPSARGVASIPFTWDGNRRVEGVGRRA